MSDNLKIQLISALNTFTATFLSAVALTVQNGVEWTTAFWLALVITAGRTALKEVINSFLPVKLGGRR